MLKKTLKKKFLQSIIVVGAKQHNLKNISIEIPRNKLVVITGLSGSGKSSLAFDTIYAEGQRRYVESLSSYARQFLDMMEKPEVDFIEGLSPAISIEQKSTSKNPRSTVGTVTEIYDYMRLLFARIGIPISPKTGKEIKSQSVGEIVDIILNMKKNSKFLLLSPIVNNRKGEFKKELSEFSTKGFIRFKINGEIYTYERLPKLDKNKKHSIQVVVDRLKVDQNSKSRISESVETALNISDGVIYVENLDENKVITFSSKFACPESGFTIEEIEPRLFSFNNPNGACKDCDGLGFNETFDKELIIGDKNLSFEDGVIIPWDKKNNLFYTELINEVANHFSLSIKTKWKDIDDSVKEQILYGDNKPINIKFSYFKRGPTTKIYDGVIGFLKKKLARSDLWQREELSKYMNQFVCNSCNGSRLKKEAMAVKIDKKTIFEISSLSIKDAKKWFEYLEKKLTGNRKEISEKIIKEIINRLNFLNDVGLGYLNLSRSSTSLSGGETQRIRLASQIGSGLTGVLYVLDEPSIGLHQRDNDKLIQTLKKLRDIGNSVIVVEHDEDTILAADYLIDIGPKAGINGGEIIAYGKPNEVKKNNKSLTGKYLSRKLKIEPNLGNRSVNTKNILEIRGAKGNNLKNINVKLPLNNFISVTGVSGGGKSTLVIETLYKALSKKINFSKDIPLKYDNLIGFENIDKIIKIDQSPIGRTPRSNPATYTGCFTHIRDWYAGLPDSKIKGYTPGRFSFNVKGGRCENCKGDGVIRIEMHFLADIFVKCDLCNGQRFNRETLEVKFKNKSISDVLNLTVEEGYKFFKAIPMISSKLNTLIRVGLDYIKIGQSATTLSGGEAQRIRLSRELSKRSTGKTLYILDEPTTGLHTHDVKKLLEVLHELVNKGNTVIVIEHNLDVIKTSDWIIDLGPEGGDGGGKILFQGSLDEILKYKNNSTSFYLNEIIRR